MTMLKPMDTIPNTQRPSTYARTNAGLRLAADFVCGTDERYIVLDPHNYTIIDYRPEITGYSSATGALSLLRGNSSVVVFHRLRVTPASRGQGIGRAMHLLRLSIAREYGASLALCTVRNDNAAERAILTRHGWSISASFVNPQGHLVSLWARSFTHTTATT